MTLKEFLQAVQDNADRVHKYHSGSDGSDGTCDCIGQIMGAVRMCGVQWPWTHGSNYAARNRITGLRYVSKTSELQLGDIVFKAREPGEEKYSADIINTTYKNSPDKRDYYHVGVVTSVSPFCVTHCTSVEGGIMRDSSLGKWHYAGKLNLINYEEEDKPMAESVNYKAEVYANSGSTVNLRANPSTKATVQKAIRVGAEVEVVEESNDEWAKVKANGVTGYMMRKFLVEKGDDNIEQVTLTLDRDVALALYAALQGVVRE